VLTLINIINPWMFVVCYVVKETTLKCLRNVSVMFPIINNATLGSFEKQQNRMCCDVVQGNCGVGAYANQALVSDAIVVRLSAKRNVGALLLSCWSKGVLAKSGLTKYIAKAS
jgi:hypothetical protein